MEDEEILSARFPEFISGDDMGMRKAEWELMSYELEEDGDECRVLTSHMFICAVYRSQILANEAGKRWYRSWFSVSWHNWR